LAALLAVAGDAADGRRQPPHRRGDYSGSVAAVAAWPARLFVASRARRDDSGGAATSDRLSHLHDGQMAFGRWAWPIAELARLRSFVCAGSVRGGQLGAEAIHSLLRARG